MPSRNTVKEAIPDATYHAYNRGVERRRIFIDSHDYRRFKQQIKEALIREPTVSLLAFSLMPNHFHLLVRQADANGMSRFMRRVSIAYAMYFNRRYKRIGPLYQGKYKAVRIIGPQQLMDVSRYIHLNPSRAHLGWRQNKHSSIACYLEGQDAGGLVDTAPVLELFDLPDDYEHFLSIRKVRS